MATNRAAPCCIRVELGDFVSKREYVWEPGQLPPVIYVHSLKKHQVLHAYLVRYLQILNSNPVFDHFRLTLIDGFSGGGVYRHEENGEIIYGSPFIFLQATKEAEFLINQERKKKLFLDVVNFFVEQKKLSTKELKDIIDIIEKNK